MANYFSHLNYTMGDEDASPEMHLLSNGTKHVMAVADCGSRIIPLLAKAPKEITCVDINRQQLAVCQLRLALLKQCELHTFKAFLGYEEGMAALERKQIFLDLEIDVECKQVLQEMFEHIDWDVMLYFGKFEKMLRTLSKVNRFLIGRTGISIFDSADLDAQVAFYKRGFPRLRWGFVLILLGNATVLNSLLYKGDFPKKNISGSYFSIYKNIFKQLFTEQLAKKSFFLQMIFFGKLVYSDGYLIECDPEVYLLAQQAIRNCKVSFVEGDIFETVRTSKNIDFLSLSDVPSFLSSEKEADYLEKMKPGLAKGAIVIVRAHLRVIRPKINGYTDISLQYLHLKNIEATRLWSFHVYQFQ
ncbi:DUF3419 family protein [Glaciimonas sp. GG7]